MNVLLETPFVAEIRIPKTLIKQAAEVFALQLVSISLPIIRTLSYKEPEEESPTEETKEAPKDDKGQELKENLMLDHLKRLKSWYWNDTSKFFGERDSTLRIIISKSLLEVIDMNENLFPFEPLHKFAMQLIFGCEAGSMRGVTPYIIERPIMQQFSKFLISTAPFYIHELRDLSIRFREPLPINLVMINSPELKRIRLYQNISSSSLERMRITCGRAEAITLDIDNDVKHSRLVLGDCFFKTFFGNKGKDFVCQLMNSSSVVPQSFPDLKEVCIKCDHITMSLHIFVQSLQYAYNKVRLAISCLVAVPYDCFARKYPFVCPTFQVVGSDNHDAKITCIYFCNEDLEIDETTGPAPVRVVAAELFMNSYRAFFTNTYYMQDIMSMMQVCNLRYIFCEDLKLEASLRIALHPDKLRELYVFGPIRDESADENLVESLNQCPELKVLCFTIKPMITPVLEGLYPLINLKVLSIYFTALKPCSAIVDSRFPHCLGTPLKVTDAEMFVELLIIAAPNLEVLEVPCMDVLSLLTGGGFLQKLHTFSVINGYLDRIVDCVVNLPSLKFLLLERFVDYNTFLGLKRRFNYSRLNISYKKERFALPYIF